MSALVLNSVVKVYSDWLNRQMDSSNSVFIIFSGRTETAFKEEEKFSFSLGSVIGFPAIFLMTFLTSFGGRHIRLLLLVPIQISLVSMVFPFSIIYNNSKIKRRASNTLSDIADTFETHWRNFKKLRTRQVAPKIIVFNSGLEKNPEIQL